MVGFGVLLEYVANFEQDAIHLFLTVFSTITLLRYIVYMATSSRSRWNLMYVCVHSIFGCILTVGYGRHATPGVHQVFPGLLT